MTAILVIGNHRSGSSMLAGVLHKLGVNMGEDGSNTTYDSNPWGQFEDIELVKACAKVIGNWRAPALFATIEDTKALVALIKERNEQNLWGFKSPQMCYCGKVFFDTLPDYKIIAPVRNFDDMVDSLIKRDDFPKAVAEFILSGYLTQQRVTFIGTAKTGDTILTVDYDEFRKYPSSIIEAIIVHLGITPTPEQREAARAHIR